MSRHHNMDCDASVGTAYEKAYMLQTNPSMASAGYDARVLSQATSQATIAAKSILSSGGTEQTALKTAKAAAEGVLLGKEKDLGSGPKSMMKRRKIKKQAEIVASMALVSACNSHKQGTEWDLLSNTDTQKDHRLQLMQVQYDIDRAPSQSTGHASATDNRSDVSTSISSISSRTNARALNAVRASGTSPVERLPMNLPTPRAPKNIPAPIQEEPSGSLFSMTSADVSSVEEEKDITRFVAIHVETTPNTSHGHQSTLRSTTTATGTRSDEPMNIVGCTDDNRYYRKSYRDVSDSEDESVASDDSGIESVSSQHSVTNGPSFMASTILSITNAFQCGPKTPIASNAGDDEQSTNRSPSKAGVTETSPPVALNQRQASSSSCSSVESDELFRSLRSYDGDDPGSETDESYDKNRRSRRGDSDRRQDPDSSSSESNDDDQASESDDDSEATEESYNYKQKNRKLAKKPWTLLRGGTRVGDKMSKKGASSQE